jgi:hypothetical protein
VRAESRRRSPESDCFRRKGTPNAMYRVWEPNPPMSRFSKGVRPMNRLRRTSQVHAILPAAPLRVGVGMRDRRRVVGQTDFGLRISDCGLKRDLRPTAFGLGFVRTATCSNLVFLRKFWKGCHVNHANHRNYVSRRGAGTQGRKDRLGSLISASPRLCARRFWLRPEAALGSPCPPWFQENKESVGQAPPYPCWMGPAAPLREQILRECLLNLGGTRV